MPSLRPVVLAVVVLSLSAAAGALQFRSTTDLVSVYTTVQDQAGRLVPDLEQGDFIVTDNGKEQPLTFFSNEIIPFSVVVMLDRSGSMLDHQYTIRDAAMAFVVRLLPADQARIGSFGDAPGNTIKLSPPDFTSSKEDLVSVLQVPSGRLGNSPVWASINYSVSALGGQTGRRVVLIFTDGHNEPAPDPISVNVKSLIERVRLANVMVYAIAFTDLQRSGRSQRIVPPDPDLRRLAEDSGGGYFEVTDAERLGPLFTRVSEELHHQYWLGFAPPVRDGKIHRIDVKVRKPGMAARGRQTYVAPVGGQNDLGSRFR
jgi:Ca-activated chloride channel family protein